MSKLLWTCDAVLGDRDEFLLAAEHEAALPSEIASACVVAVLGLWILTPEYCVEIMACTPEAMDAP